MTATILKRPAAITRGLAVIAGTIAFMVGIPWALVHFVGNPLPTVVPSFDGIRFAISHGQVDQQTIIKIVAVIVWLAWAHLAASFAVEIAAAIRGGTAAAVRGLGATQWLAARAVSKFTLLFTLLFQSTVGMALAAPLPPVPTLSLATATPTATLDIGSTFAFYGPADDELSITTESDGASVTVERRDTLWGLAEHHLGDGQRWEEIRDANVGRTMPDGCTLREGFTSLEAGWTLVIPGSEALITDTADDSSGDAIDVEAGVEELETGYDTATGEWIIGSWEVKPGDHFWKISETLLEEAWGRPASNAEITSYWLNVVDANRQHLISPDDDPNLIYPDQHFEVLLPPVPADIRSPGDAANTTTPFALDGLEQFTAANPLPVRPAQVSEAAAPSMPDPVVTPAPIPVQESEPVVPPTVPVQETVVEAATPEPETAPADTSNETGSSLDVRTIGLGLFGTAIGAGALMTVLGRRRQHQAARRRPNTVIEETPVMPSEFEHRIRPIGNTDAVRWLDGTNRFLSHRLAEHPENPLPAVVAMRAGDFGVEVLLDETCLPVDGFINGGAEGKAWRLHPDLDERMIEAEARHAHPYSPALLPVGTTEAGDLLLDFEQIGSLSLTGDTDTIEGWLRSIAVGVTSVPWSQHCEVVAIGLGDDIADIPQVTVPDDPAEWVRTAVTIHTATAKRLSASTYEQRVHPGELHYPQLVLVGPGHPGIAQHLADTADLAYSPLALIAAAPLTNETRIDMQPNQATIEPLGIDFEPSTTEIDAIKLVVESLAAAGNTVSTPEPEFFGEAEEVPVGDDSAAEASGSELAEDETSLVDQPEVKDTTADTIDDASGNPDAEDRDMPPSETATTPQPQAEGVELLVEPDHALTDQAAKPPFVDESEPIEHATTATSNDVLRPVVVDLVELETNGHRSPACDVSVGVSQAVAAITEVRPVEVRVLGPFPTIEGLDGEPRAKIAAVIVYVAFCRSLPAERIRSVFWPTSVSRGTADNAVAEARRILGHNTAGDSRLPLATNSGRFEVDDEIGCDWNRFEQLTEVASTATNPADEAACLQAALALVVDRPMREAPQKLYRWFSDDFEVYVRVETAIVDAAYRLGELAVEQGNAETARWAATKGLQAVPGQEALHRIQMKAAALIGDQQGIEDAYRSAMRSAEALSAWEDVQPETDELYSLLTRRSAWTSGENV